MAISIPNGALVAIANAYGTPATISALTNANPGVATLSASHGVLAGDIVEVTSGWSRLDKKIIKAGTVTTNDVQFLGLDSTLTTIYPAGSGLGSVREITGWTQLSQILTSSTSGGDQQFLTYQLLESDAQKQIPTFKNPFNVTFTVADDAALAGFILAGQANDDRLPRAVRITLPSGSILYYNAYISLNRTPSLTVNTIMECQVTLALLAEPTRY